MRSILFKIETDYSVESFYTVVKPEESEILAIDNYMASICFCDDYEVISVEDAETNTYYLVGDTGHMNGHSKDIDYLISESAEHETADIYYNSVLIWKKGEN